MYYALSQYVCTYWDNDILFALWLSTGGKETIIIFFTELQ